MKKEKFYTFDQKIFKEVWKTVHNEQIDGGTEELYNYLSTKWKTKNNTEKHIELI